MVEIEFNVGGLPLESLSGTSPITKNHEIGEFGKLVNYTNSLKSDLGVDKALRALSGKLYTGGFEGDNIKNLSLVDLYYMFKSKKKSEVISFGLKKSPEISQIRLRSYSENSEEFSNRFENNGKNLDGFSSTYSTLLSGLNLEYKLPSLQIKKNISLDRVN